jgi:hypothetical protein
MLRLKAKILQILLNTSMQHAYYRPCSSEPQSLYTCQNQILSNTDSSIFPILYSWQNLHQCFWKALWFHICVNDFMACACTHTRTQYMAQDMSTRLKLVSPAFRIQRIVTMKRRQNGTMKCCNLLIWDKAQCLTNCSLCEILWNKLYLEQIFKISIYANSEEIIVWKFIYSISLSNCTILWSGHIQTLTLLIEFRP